MTDEIEEELANHEATMHCTCEKAIEYKRVTEMKEAACNNVDALFQDQPHDVTELFKEAIAQIAERRINSATIKISSRSSATLAKGKDGIVIKRKYTEENTMES